MLTLDLRRVIVSVHRKSKVRILFNHSRDQNERNDSKKCQNVTGFYLNDRNKFSVKPAWLPELHRFIL